jgi:galactokinase
MPLSILFIFLSSHVDHMRFSCMPAALEMDILMAFRVRSSPSSTSSSSSVNFRLENSNEQFKSTTFRCSLKGSDCVGLEHCGPSRWANYFKVAYKVGARFVSDN